MTTEPAPPAQDPSGYQHGDNSHLIEKDGTVPHPGTRPLSNLSSSSGNTEESLSAFAGQTLRALAHLDPSLDITFLTSTSEGFQQRELEPTTGKASESEVLTTVQPKIQKIDIEQQGTTRLFDPSTFDLPEEQQRNNFQTDASEVEDICDSAGADGLTDRPTSSIVGFDLLRAPGDSQ